MNIDKDIQQLQGGDYETGWKIFNWVREKRTVAKADLVAARNSLAEQLLKLKEQSQALISSGYREEHLLEALERENDLTIAVHMLNMALTHSAAQKGLTLENDQALKVEEGKSKIKIHEEEEHVRIELYKYREMKDVDLKNLLEEMRERVRLAIIADYLTEHQKIQLILEQADLLYEQIQGIQENPSLNEITKRRMINDREEFILTLKEDRRGREDRLLQTNNGQGHRQVGKDTNLRGDYRKAIEAWKE